MASIENTSNTTTNGHFGSFISSIVASVAAWNDARLTRNALRQLSDRELEDIGLSRDDINGIR
ncbi:uncharacterized protein DUF1127 [Shimia isoporae]|uniref:Uncharacterized protein DUF1127 n=1 Tax=Shimia isoporae TaxID=647720 RepID=A0A4R1NLT2_9RHOB|nr:DUF1127 domain-containing protein [Shimia isoporae]TCL08679.1 uncharacterized protein DUF1127 [Shimia isoporae]